METRIVICFIGGGGEVQKRDYSEARREYRSFTTKPAQPKLPCFFQECQRSARHAEVRAGGGGAHRGVPGRPLTLEKETWQLSVLRGLKLRYSICRTESRFWTTPPPPITHIILSYFEFYRYFLMIGSIFLDFGKTCGHFSAKGCEISEQKVPTCRNFLEIRETWYFKIAVYSNFEISCLPNFKKHMAKQEVTSQHSFLNQFQNRFSFRNRKSAEQLAPLQFWFTLRSVNISVSVYNFQSKISFEFQRYFLRNSFVINSKQVQSDQG